MNTKDYSPESLGDRFSKYESEYRTYLDETKYTVIRLDGRGFSKFTKSFNEPFDDNFITCMNEATKALFKTFQNTEYGYCQSDEITIILRPVNNENEELPFKGRTDKILSLASSSVTGEFIRQMFVTKLFNIDYLFNGKLPEFDARYFQVDTIQEAINALIARQNDCYRNAVSSIGQYHFSHNELKNKNIDQVTEMIKNIGDDVNAYNSHKLLGRLIKKTRQHFQNTENDTAYFRTKVIIEEKTERFRKMFDKYFQESK